MALTAVQRVVIQRNFDVRSDSSVLSVMIKLRINVETLPPPARLDRNAAINHQ